MANALVTAADSTGPAISEEETDLVKAEHEAIARQALVEKKEIEHQTSETPTVVKTEPDQKQSDERSSHLAPNLEEVNQSASDSSTDQPTAPQGEALSTKTENIEPKPPSDSPE